MKTWGTCLIISAALSAGVALAAPPAPQYSADDIIKQFANGASPDKSGDASAPASGQGGCAALGMVAGDDGVCEPAKKERGFRLPTKTNPGGGASRSESAATAGPAPVRAVERPVRRVSNVKRDLLITFKLGSAVLTDQAQSNAREFASALQSSALADAKFEVSGYTDSTGAPARNLTLSQERADAVKAFLLSQGVDGTRILAKGYGASDFAVSNPASPANRRVEARRVD
jgi:outer membrane protein OmpA-like peptidoglycan-associated protein